MARIDVITGVERRRRWSVEQKRAVVAAAFAPGVVVADVARRADVCSSLIYRWRRELADAPGGFADIQPAVDVGVWGRGQRVSVVHHVHRPGRRRVDDHRCAISQRLVQSFLVVKPEPSAAAPKVPLKSLPILATSPAAA